MGSNDDDEEEGEACNLSSKGRARNLRREVGDKPESPEALWHLAPQLARAVGDAQHVHLLDHCFAVQDSGFQNSLAEMWSCSEEGSYLRLIDCCITQL